MMNIRLVNTGNSYFADCAKDYDYHHFDITNDDIKVGTLDIIDWFNEDNTTAYVERIDIDEEYRNQGIGTQVLSDVLQAMYRAVIVAPDNDDAKRLYERIGSEYRAYGDEYDFSYNDQGYGVYVI